MFEFRVEDVFSITGRGTVFAGQVISGSVRIGDRIVCRTPALEIVDHVIGIESVHKMLKSANEGDTVGILCRRIQYADLKGCFQGEGENRKLVGLTLVSAPPAPWWKFW